MNFCPLFSIHNKSQRYKGFLIIDICAIFVGVGCCSQKITSSLSAIYTVMYILIG